MKNIAILASGSGSNAENVANYFTDSAIAKVSLIITNKKDAFVLERAKKMEIESHFFSKEELLSPDFVSFLENQNIDLIVLAGFLLKISPSLVDVYANRIINIHPALLPRYGGKGMYGDNVHKAVVNAREKESGITIHYVNENYDEGNIIFQAKCEVDRTDTFEDVAKKVHILEYTHFPIIIEKIIKDLI